MMGRPRKEIDQNSFEKLCGLQCTEDEICDFFDTTRKTVDAWCKRTYKASFSTVFEQKRGVGKISLRRMQWKLAEKNAAMAIFLGKNILGQSDTVRLESRADGKLADLIDGLREDNDLHTETAGIDADMADE